MENRHTEFESLVPTEHNQTNHSITKVQGDVHHFESRFQEYERMDKHESM